VRHGKFGSNQTFFLEILWHNFAKPLLKIGFGEDIENIRDVEQSNCGVFITQQAQG